MAIPEALARLAALLDGQGARWYLFGAQAAIIHGASRLSADIDVTVEVPLEALDPFVAALASGGFPARVRDVAAFVRETRVIPLVDAASGVPVDVVLAGAGPEEPFLARAQRVSLGEATISAAIMVDAQELDQPVCSDPDDDKFIACGSLEVLSSW